MQKHLFQDLLTLMRGKSTGIEVKKSSFNAN